MMYNHLDTLRALQNLMFGNAGQPAMTDAQINQANDIINAASNNAASNNAAPTGNEVDRLQEFANTPANERQGIVGMPSAQSALNAGFGLGVPVGGFPEKKPEPVSSINTSQQLEYDPPLDKGLMSSEQSAIDAGFSDAGESQFDVTGSTLPQNLGSGNTLQALASAGQLAKALEEKPIQSVHTSPTVRAYTPVENPYAALDLQPRPRMGLKLSNL